MSHNIDSVLGSPSAIPAAASPSCPVLQPVPPLGRWALASSSPWASPAAHAPRVSQGAAAPEPGALLCCPGHPGAPETPHGQAGPRVSQCPLGSIRPHSVTVLSVLPEAPHHPAKATGVVPVTASMIPVTPSPSQYIPADPSMLPVTPSSSQLLPA